MQLQPIPTSQRNAWRRPAADQGAGVGAFLAHTYRWMALGLGLTGLTAWLAAQVPLLQQLMLGSPAARLALTVAPLVMVVVCSRKLATASAQAAAGMFLAYSALNGLSFSLLFLLYANATLTQAFLVSAGAFAALSAFGATTHRDLTPVGQFMRIGLIGLVVASCANLFFHSDAVHWVSTYAGVLIFSGLTAYDNQKLRRLYEANGGAGNLAIFGALTLYLDFINMFFVMLRLFGGSSRR